MPPINPSSANGTTLPWAQFVSLAQACDPRPKASSSAPSDVYDSTSSTTLEGRGGPGRTRPTVAGNSTTPFAFPTSSQSTPPQPDCQFFETNYGEFCSLLGRASDVNTAVNMTRDDFVALQTYANRFVQEAGRSSFVLPETQIQNCTLLAEQAGLRANPPPTTTVAPPVGGGDGPAIQPWGWALIGIASAAVVAGVTWGVCVIRNRRVAARRDLFGHEGIGNNALRMDLVLDPNALDQPVRGRRGHTLAVHQFEFDAVDGVDHRALGDRRGAVRRGFDDDGEGDQFLDRRSVSAFGGEQPRPPARNEFLGRPQEGEETVDWDSLAPSVTDRTIAQLAAQGHDLAPAPAVPLLAGVQIQAVDTSVSLWGRLEATTAEYVATVQALALPEIEKRYMANEPDVFRFSNILPARETRVPGIHGNDVQFYDDFPMHMLHQYPQTVGAAIGDVPGYGHNAAYMAAFCTELMRQQQQARVMLDLTSDFDRQGGGRLAGVPEWYPSQVGDEHIKHYLGFDVACTAVAHADAEYDLLTLRVINTVTNDYVEKTMVHYKGWPDGGAPDAGFAALMRDVVVPAAGGQGLIINCTAGVGRSGTAAVLFEIERMALARQNLSRQDVMNMAAKGRMMRAKEFIQTHQQLTYVLEQPNLRADAPRQARAADAHDVDFPDLAGEEDIHAEGADAPDDAHRPRRIQVRNENGSIYSADAVDA